MYNTMPNLASRSRSDNTVFMIKTLYRSCDTRIMQHIKASEQDTEIIRFDVTEVPPENRVAVGFKGVVASPAEEDVLLTGLELAAILGDPSAVVDRM